MGAGRSWLCSALEVRIGHRQQVVAGQIPFEPMNALNLPVIAGIKYARHRDDHGAQAVDGMHSVRIRKLCVVNPSWNESNPAEEFPMPIQAPVQLVADQFALRRSCIDIGTCEIRLDDLGRFDHRAKHD